MQRIPLLSLALLSTVAASSEALAGPLSINPVPQRSAAPPIASIYGAPPPAEPLPMRQVSAQGRYGGGFFEFLMRGPGGGPPSANYRQYPGEPADLGPGMVEFPGQPGQAVMDPRYIKQEVSYDGNEAAGTIIINTRERLLYLVQGNGRTHREGINPKEGQYHASERDEGAVEGRWPNYPSQPNVDQTGGEDAEGLL